MVHGGVGNESVEHGRNRRNNNARVNEKRDCNSKQ